MPKTTRGSRLLHLIDLPAPSTITRLAEFCSVRSHTRIVDRLFIPSWLAHCIQCDTPQRFVNLLYKPRDRNTNTITNVLQHVTLVLRSEKALLRYRAWILCYKLTEFPSESGQGESSCGPSLERWHVFPLGRLPPSLALCERIDNPFFSSSKGWQIAEWVCTSTKRRSVMGCRCLQNGTRLDRQPKLAHLSVVVP